MADESGKICSWIIVRKHQLEITRQFFIRHFEREVSIAETILIVMLHETIHAFEDVTKMIYMSHSQSFVSPDEMAILSRFTREHPEYFTQENNAEIINQIAQAKE